jgi:hypothetical protein
VERLQRSRPRSSRQLPRNLRQLLVLAIRMPVFDQNILVFCKARFTQTFPECRNKGNRKPRRSTMKPAHHWRARLLGARRKRPSRCTADQSDELASFHLRLTPHRIGSK